MIKNLIILSLLLKSCASNGNGNTNSEDSLSQSKSVQTQITSKQEMTDSNFLFFWQRFTDVIRLGNHSQFRKISIDTLECEHINVHADKFIKNYFTKIFDDSLLTKLTDSKKADVINAAMEPLYFSPFIRQQIKNDNYIIKEVNITNGKYPNILITTLKFIETDSGYKFYGYDRFGG
jgi:hypothetical protein